MAYNFSLKSYANGTYQLTYYNTPILDGFDMYLATCSLSDPSYIYDSYREYDDSDNYTPWGYAEFMEMKDDAGKPTERIIALSDEEIERRRQHSISSSLCRSVHKVYDYGRNNIWEWFFTFTLSEDVVSDRCDYNVCSGKVRKWLNNIKNRKCPDMKYLLIPEMHPTSGAWHFHALVSNVSELTFEKAVNNQKYLKDENGNIIFRKGKEVPNKYFGEYLKTSYPDGNYIYNVKEYKNGWSTATRIVDTKKAVSYIVKYLTKDLCQCTFGRRRFYPSNNLTLPTREVGLFEKQSLDEIISSIEYNYNVKLSRDVIKTIVIKNDGYENTISYLEFE